VLASLAAWAILAPRRGRPRHAEIALQRGAVLPVACGAALSLAVLAVAKPPPIPGEGFYYFRYFVPFQLAFFWLAALGVEEITLRLGNSVFAAAMVATLALALTTQLPLYHGPNSYVPDADRDLQAGCAVFGHAEVDRAASDESAVARLEEITNAGCKRAAFTGYGWGVVSRYARDGDGAFLAASLDEVRDPTLRGNACDSARRLMTNLYEGAMSRDRRHTGALYIESVCAPQALEKPS